MPLHHSWTDGLGVQVEEEPVAHRAWADNAWLSGDTPCNTVVMLSELESAAADETGLLIRWEKCTVMDMDPEATMTGPDTGHDARTSVLHNTTRAEKGRCARMLGAAIQIGAGHSGEWDATRQQCWATFHFRRRFWKLKGFGVEKARM